MPPVAPALPLVIQRRLTTWSPDGIPIVQKVPMMPKAEMLDLAAAALSLPYDDPFMLEPQYEGMTCGEVNVAKRAQRAARTGDREEGEALFDRAVGKPKQTTESLRVNVTYEGYLADIAGKTAAASAPPTSPSTVMEAEIVPSSPPSAPSSTLPPAPPLPADLVDPFA